MDVVKNKMVEKANRLTFKKVHRKIKRKALT